MISAAKYLLTVRPTRSLGEQDLYSLWELASSLVALAHTIVVLLLTAFGILVTLYDVAITLLPFVIPLYHKVRQVWHQHPPEPARTSGKVYQLLVLTPLCSRCQDGFLQESAVNQG